MTRCAGRSLAGPPQGGREAATRMLPGAHLVPGQSQEQRMARRVERVRRVRASGGNTWRQRAWLALHWAHAVLIMLHPIPVLAVLLATAAFALTLGAPRAPGTFLRLVGTMAGIQLAIGAVNDYVDLPLDRHSKPWKPLVSGALRPGAALWLTAGGLVAALVLVAPLGLATAALALLGTGMGMVYNLYLKRTGWSWLPYLIAIPLLPIWVWTALRGWEARLLWLYPLGGSMVVALHLADTLPDIRADARHGIRGVAHRLGERRARGVCWLCAGLAPLASVTAAWAGLADLPVVVAAATLAWLLIAAAIAYSLRARRWEWRLHFFLLAAATSILGIGWLVALR
jgi:4-hydroxybenzoate polyprenyltransferase